MKILIACEESGRVTSAFRNKGHEAFSCDLKPTTGNLPQYHYQENVLNILNCEKWDMLIAFPPCTYLTNVQSVWLYNNEERRKKSELAKQFFLELWNSNIEKICIENPVPNKSIGLPPYSQIIQPFNFGANYKKRTCLWLKNLPPLIETCIGNQVQFDSWTMKWRNAAIRSKTFSEVAEAMAQQWNF